MGSQEYTVRILTHGEELERNCTEGVQLLSLLNANGHTLIDAPCGGNGNCGKCKVHVKYGNVAAPDGGETDLLTPEELTLGIRLACRLKVTNDLIVALPEDHRGERGRAASVLTEGSERHIEGAAHSTKIYVQLDAPTIEDQRSDEERLIDALGASGTSVSFPLMQSLPTVLREANFSVTATCALGQVTAVEPGDTTGSHVGIAVDIGTTTVVAYLVDLLTQDRIDAASGLNKQRAHGSDVISRIQFGTDQPDGLETLKQEIVGQIQNLVDELLLRHNIPASSISDITLAGNTTMMHLLAGISPQYIASSPFTPVFKSSISLRATQLGLHIGATAHLLPGISGYVGADIVAAILSSSLPLETKPAVLIDIGTNGEIAFGGRDGIRCCSTAAGPAFEGAHIRFGIGGVAGAINTVNLSDSGPATTTIGDDSPIGICGSGIVDAMAMLLDAGADDETGRLLDAEEFAEKGDPRLLDALTTFEGESAVLLCGDDDEKNAIYLTQKDVREVQLAKASIAAGIRTLIAESGADIADVGHVFIAGGFGSFINQKHAVRIGLIPKELGDRTQVIGNAAGSGACSALTSANGLSECSRIAQNAEYLELSSSLKFQTEYVNEMYF